ncbi:hypothetical protein [Aneurinibacillus soli]|uniref:hypothetical protein n=1 Tax=Aneurinibacillus soli TaxID=1500254 RepID=UPI0011B3BC03|nr:hypothetical protein [Aneurinibacillus soli]
MKKSLREQVDASPCPREGAPRLREHPEEEALKAAPESGTIEVPPDAYAFVIPTRRLPAYVRMW